MFCYLLRSRADERRVYIGYTTDYQRRLRQHNGALARGAAATRKNRPWELVAVVGGFATAGAALLFEFAWQHPTSLSAPFVLRRTWQRSGVLPANSSALKQLRQALEGSSVVVDGPSCWRLRVLAQMLCIPKWSSTPLQLLFFKDSDRARTLNYAPGASSILLNSAVVLAAAPGPFPPNPPGGAAGGGKEVGEVRLPAARKRKRQASPIQAIGKEPVLDGGSVVVVDSDVEVL